MNKTYPFKWLDESENLIVVNVEVNEETPLRFLLDTGASETCFDKNIVLIENISLKELVEQVTIETANGWIVADVFLIDTIDVLGLRLKNHPVQVIDFIANGIMSNYAGILGMDILTQRNLCFNFDKQTFSIAR
jgi:predicted aspartyl protease